jgi:hypothetical protein
MTQPHPVPDPIARLEAAATHLRTLLADPELTEGPWLSLDHGDRLLRNQPGDEDTAPIYVVNEPMSNGANAAWIALMHPGAGVPIATMLDQAAARMRALRRAAERIWVDEGVDDAAGLEEFMAEGLKKVAPALALADTILTGADQ